MIAYAYGELGIEQEFLLHRMTFADYQIKAYYHVKRQEREYKERFEQLRYIGCYQLIPHLDPKKSVPAFDKLIPLPWEIESRKKPSKRQLEKRRAEMDEVIKAHQMIWQSKVNAEA